MSYYIQFLLVKLFVLLNCPLIPIRTNSSDGKENFFIWAIQSTIIGT